MGRDYATWYEGATRALREAPARVRRMEVANDVMAALCALAYAVVLVSCLVTGDARLWRYVAVPGSGFVLVSAMRVAIGARRPYEDGVASLLSKDTRGKSFPSRHVYSAFAIAFAVVDRAVGFSAGAGVGAVDAWALVWAILAVVLLAMASALAYVRVIGGVHYPRDVIAGALIALALAAVGYALPWGP